MSARKSSGIVNVNVKDKDVEDVEPPPKEKDNSEAATSITEDDKEDKTNAATTTTEITISVKVEPESVTRSGTPTRNRVTRNSPLLISPNTKKDHQPSIPIESSAEPTISSDGEDPGSAQQKQQIRGRKSIKEAKDIVRKESPCETQPTTEEPDASKDKSQNESNKEIKDKDQKDKENESKERKKDEESSTSSSSEVKDVEDNDQVIEDCQAEQTAVKETKLETTDVEKDIKIVVVVESNEGDPKDLKEIKDKDNRGDPKEIQDKDKDTKDSKETKDKDLKDLKTVKEVKEVKEPASPAAAVTNRLTRNAAAQEVASNSRITRNRQSSAGSSSARPETPPTSRGRGRGGKNASLGQKRKRSIEEPSDSPTNKAIKTEPKDCNDLNPDEDELSVSITSSGLSDLEGVRIKQELIESDDGGSMATEFVSGAAANAVNVTTTTTTTATTTTPSRGRGGGRWGGRKPAQTVSPSTRSTRQNKLASPVPSNSSMPDRKRRRTAGLKRGSSLPKSTTIHGTPDEDSKDSITSSMDDTLPGDVKMEDQDIEMQTKKCSEEDLDESMEEHTGKIEIDSIETPSEPLTVETGTEIIGAAIEQLEETTVSPSEASTSTEAAKCLNKDSSLSPELSEVSEGVSEISVKQFYKKPKFLENNLGIEEDPKLGEIVQKATTEMDNEVTASKEDTNIVVDKDAANGDIEHLDDDVVVAEIVNVTTASDTNLALDESFSAGSLKEGDLVYEESSDGKKSPACLPAPEVVDSPTDVIPSAEEVAEVFQEQMATEEFLESADADDKTSDSKDHDELFEGPLFIAEDDLDDDDLTVEGSETISMDNNASLHDDAAEEEQDAEEGDIPVDELPEDCGNNVEESNDENDKMIKETSNVCDIEKAKLEENEEKTDVVKEENEDLKIESIESDCNVDDEDDGEEENKLEEKETKVNIVASNRIVEEAVAKSLPSTSVKGGFKVTKTEEIIPKKLPEKRTEEKKIKSIIVTKFASDDKEPERIPTKDLKAIEKVIKGEMGKTSNTKSSSDKTRKMSITQRIEIMDVDEVKAEVKVVDQAIKDEKKYPLKSQSPIEVMDTSPTGTPFKDEKVNSNTSESNSPSKSSIRYLRDSRDDDANSVKSTQSTDAASWTTIEQDCDDEEKLRQKEQHLKNLGLLTHKAAEKRRQEFIQTAAAVEATRAAAASSTATHHHGKRNGNKSANSLASNSSNNNNTTSHEYTGTLKTVIKINRNALGAAVANTTAITVSTASSSNGGGGGNSSSSGGGGGGAGGRKAHLANAKDNHNTGVRRQSLKMTFQKGRGRGHTVHNNDRAGNTNSAGHSGDRNEHGEDLYYTIQNENEGGQKFTSGSSLSTATAGTKDHQSQKQQNIIINNNSSNVQTHGRKSYNSRSNTSTTSYNNLQNHHFTTKNSSHFDSSHSDAHHHHDGTTAYPSTTHATHVGLGIHNKKDDREEILIPEKASSFKFHPGRLCEDQCYYCSGKFGLYDTPCHVGQIKSVERQQKILRNEEKLTVDNCLCDACFRHVDRRANVPSYKKRLSGPSHLESSTTSGERQLDESGGGANAEDSEGGRKCVVPDCGQSASHSLRRKCIRKSVKKFLLNFDMPTGSPYIWLCQSHYDAVIQCSGCVLCKRRLGKNHMYHITSDTERLEKALTDMGIPVQLGIGTAVCKLCRYFANLLMKPPDSTKSQKAEFVKNYRKRLLQFHNIHDGSNDVSEADDDENTPNSSRTKDKGTKSTPNQRKNKDQNQTTSPSGMSSGSSVVCLSENANDAGDGDGDGDEMKAHEKSQKKSTMLENDVLVDYGMSAQNSSSGGEISNENSKSPIPSPDTDENDRNCRLKAILQSDGGKNQSTTNSEQLPTVLLRANPNLSMRELFPGEEDLGLNFKAPFGSNNSQRTPEGWTRVQTFLQYDEPTRRLWEELQKPYGNQSSFLRHLILLEKYYRNGDLVLSANASSHASVYTQTVRQRLNSYDQGHCGGLDAVIINAKSSPQPETKEETTNASDIPLVEINDDDEDEGMKANEKKRISLKTRGDKENGDEDDDAIMEESPSNADRNSSSNRSAARCISVDKLTRQLSTNAVTITARPKDATTMQQQQSSSNTSKHNTSVDNITKRTELMPKLPSTTSSAILQNSISGGALPTPVSASTSAMTSLTTMSAPGSTSASNSSSSSSSSTSNSNSRSILKSNLLGIANNKSVEILPISTQKGGGNVPSTISVTTPNSLMDVGVSSKGVSSGGVTNTSNTSKQQKILEVANKLLDSQMEAAAAAAAAAAAKQQQQNPAAVTSPPELVSLQRRAPNTSISTSIGPAAANTTSMAMSSTTASLINAKRPHLLPNRPAGGGGGHSRGGGNSHPPNVVILPTTLSTHERAESKSWRPTLMSVDENQHLLNKNGPLYQTADGRRLPSLVQVQSGGKPFLISIFDYNRMCILRREKLMRDGMLHSGKNKSSQQQHQQQQQQHSQQQQQRHSHTQHSSNYNKMNSSGGGHGSGSINSNNSNNSSGSNSKHGQQVAVAQQQFMQMLHYQKQQQHQQAQQQQHQQHQAAMKAAASNANNNRYHPIAPKPTSISGNSATSANLMSSGGGGNSGNNSMNLNNIANNSRLAGNPSNFPMPLLANALSNANAATAAAAAAAALNNNPWLWSNFPDAHELLRNGAHGGLKNLPPLLPKPTTAPNSSVGNTLAPPSTITSKQLQQHQQMLLDNTLMSKIPKSLTVIPQHKLMGNSSSSSNAGTKE